MGLPCREEQNEDDWWINLVDRCREGVCLKTCISQLPKTSEETEEQAANWCQWQHGGDIWWEMKQEAGVHMKGVRCTKLEINITMCLEGRGRDATAKD